MLIQELRCRPATDEWSDPLVWETPGDVDATNVLSFLTQHYGAEPLDVSWTSTPEHERVEIGWTFAAAAETDAEEIVAIPLLGDGDDAVPLFIAMADQRAELESLAEQGLIAELQVVTAEQQAWPPADRG